MSEKCEADTGIEVPAETRKDARKDARKFATNKGLVLKAALERKS